MFLGRFCFGLRWLLLTVTVLGVACPLIAPLLQQHPHIEMSVPDVFASILVPFQTVVIEAGIQALAAAGFFKVPHPVPQRWRYGRTAALVGFTLVIVAGTVTASIFLLQMGASEKFYGAIALMSQAAITFTAQVKQFMGGVDRAVEDQQVQQVGEDQPIARHARLAAASKATELETFLRQQTAPNQATASQR